MGDYIFSFFNYIVYFNVSIELIIKFIKYKYESFLLIMIFFYFLNKGKSILC